MCSSNALPRRQSSFCKLKGFYMQWDRVLRQSVRSL